MCDCFFVLKRRLPRIWQRRWTCIYCSRTTTESMAREKNRDARGER